MIKFFKAFIRDDRGATTIEYAFVLVLIFLAVVGSWGALGTELRGMYGDHHSAMDTARKASAKTS